MLYSPSKSLLKDADLPNFTETLSQKKTSQHGIQHPRILVRCPILLDVPAETLACITAYLDPPGLLSVAQVNTYLNHHVNDEITWRRAFICQFLGIGPQLDINIKHTVLLRRSETSWRNEFLVRYRFRRRWERSRNGSTTHIPVHSTISSMHQMGSNGLLTSSLEYGIVARSIPVSGKILAGYLDASGSATGLGIGNPNAEFTPNISACGLASDGGTAKLVWGSRVGDVLFMSISKAMETGSRRSAAEVKRCSVADEHEGAVVDAIWLNVQPGCVVTGGVDARVKVWDAKNATCVWTSEQVFNSVIPDSCVKVAGSAQHGFVVGVFKSGQIRIWTGFDFNQSSILAGSIKEIIINNPIRTSAEGYDSSANHDVTTLAHDPSADHISVLVGYENDCYFYRIQVDPSTLDVQTLAFGEPYSGSISTIAPFFCTNETESSIIFAGDHLGCISLYEWDADPHEVNSRTNAVGPWKKFEAHRNGTSVTSIAWNGLVLVSGSVRGDVQVFDGMSFELLRKFESPHPPFGRRVTGINLEEMERQRREKEKVRILLFGPEKDVIFMGIGDRVVAWKAGPVPKYIKGGVRGRNISSWGRGKRTGQGLKHFAYLSQDIIESQDIMADEATFSARADRARGREHDQQESLATLGLSEVEAVEYVLMLSRDEANERVRNEGSANTGAVGFGTSHDIDEGVFEGDFDGGDSDDRRQRLDDGDMPTSISTDINSSGLSPPSVASSNSTGSSGSSERSSATTSPIARLGHPIPGAARVMGMPRFSPSSHSSSSSTNQKVQISPHERMEPLEAGVEWKEGNGRREIEEQVRGTRLGLEDHYFPPVGSTSKNVDEIDPTVHSRPGTSNLKPNKKRSSVPSSSAWSTPLTKKLSFSPSNMTADRVPDTSSWFAPIGSAVASGSVRVSPTASRFPFTAGVGFNATSLGVDGIEVQDESEMDEDLRFALELSLAEAKSTEEDV